MNYRTLAKGALALSLSLIVGSAMAVNTTTTDVQKYGATFENQANPPENDYDYVVDTPVTTYATSSGNGESSGWFGAAEDESKIIAVTGGQALQLNTDAGVLTNKLASSIATDLNDNGIAAAGAYIETEAKFVASDTLDAGVTGGTDDTKFAIYAYADESKSPCTTNLVVYHAYYDGAMLKYTNEVFDTLIDCEVYTKLRVEMKQTVNPRTADIINLFSVKIGTDEVLSSNLSFTEDHKWFLTVESDADENNALLSSITFKGTGEVDNLAVGIINKTTTYAIDWSASQNVIASNLTDNVQLAAGETNFVAGVQLGFYPTEGTIQSVTVNGTAETVADPYLYTVGTADAIVTVVAAQVLDDNWTIEGFNPRGEWTDPTAVAADSKTLFYSNLVVNIDPIDATEGRSIVAAWIGAKIIAPEAVTAENVGNWKFDLNATQTGLSFDQCKDGEYFMYLWVPVTAAKVRTAIANQSDIVYTVSLYQEGDSANAQILTMSICPKNIEITNTDDVENGETIDVDDWTENVPAPTVITVAQTIGAHGSSVSNGNFQAAAGVATPITITADQGYVVAQIVTNGAPVADALGETSVTFDAVFSDAEGANNSIVATFAPDSAWFLDPFVRTKTLSLGSSDNTYCAGLSPEEGLFFMGNNPGGTAAREAVEIFDVQGFIASLNPAFAPKAKAVASQVSNNGLRGGAASAELQVGIAGSITKNQNWIIPFDGGAPYKLTHEIGLAFDTLDFSANSAFLYAGAYTSGHRTEVYKLSFANNLQEGDTLSVAASYDVASAGITRVRAISVEYINGNEYVYVTGGDGAFDAVAVIDTVTGSVSKVFDGTGTSDPTSIDVAGIAAGTPRLYIGFKDRSIKVWGLAADGKSTVSTEPVTTIPVTLLENANCPNVFTLDGETNAVASGTLSATARAYVLEKKPANLIVRGTFDKGVTLDDRSVAFGAAASETFTAPAGSTITNVTVNGVAQQVAEGATSFTYEAAALNEYVYIEMLAAEPAPSAQKPAWAEASGDGTDSDPYWAWATAHAAGQDLYAEGADYSAQYLMNVDADKTPVLKIDSIGVAAGVVQLIVSATDGTDPISLKTINGVLSVAVGDTLTSLTPTACNASVNDQDGRATINLPANSGNFFRARVDFAAPAGE